MMALGLTQKSLAMKAGLNETYVRDLFKGKSLNPKGQHLAKLATALECSITDLLSVDPRRTGEQPQSGEFVDDPEEMALVRLWRTLSPLGRQLMLTSVRSAIPGRPSRRKANDI